MRARMQLQRRALTSSSLLSQNLTVWSWPTLAMKARSNVLQVQVTCQMCLQAHVTCQMRLQAQVTSTR